MELSLAIIVPLLNEVDRLPSLVKELDELSVEQIIIVDGGSTDGSIQWLQEHWVDSVGVKQLLNSSTGRAAQMNAGAEYAKQDILLFLHADTVLPKSLRSDVCAKQAMQKSEHYWGRFDVSFDESSSVMRMIAFFINWRSRLSGVATGDQAIFVQKLFFTRVGGFDDIALMEDVALSKKLRKFAKPNALNSTVVTSARRWRQDGVVRTIIKMWWYRFAYFLGVSPKYLASSYRNVR